MDFIEKIMGPVLLLAVSFASGFMTAGSTFDSPDVPKFHEREGRGSRVVVSTSSLNELYATFSFQGVTYSVPVKLLKADK